MKIAISLIFIILISSLLVLAISTSSTADLTIAVASNFANTMDELLTVYETLHIKDNSEKIIMVQGSTAKLYTQILNGAQYDILFSADTKHPQLLLEQSMGDPQSMNTYGIGKLVLWAKESVSNGSPLQRLESSNFDFLSIANPSLAPYGLAAQQTLENLGLWESIQDKIVQGENIAQALHFVESGNAELGFVALSLLEEPVRSQVINQIRKQMSSQKGTIETDSEISDHYWLVPEELYSPIEQATLILNNSDLAGKFMRFLQSENAKLIISRNGY